jgi:tetratricopeptide (TPR) repeat protein
VREATPLTAVERRAYQLGRRCFERGDDEKALEQLRWLLRSRQDYADVHYMVGILLDRQGEGRAAARSFTQALRINPDYAEARLALASLYERQGDFQRSREITQHAGPRPTSVAEILDPTTRGKLANLQAALGDAYREAGELHEAIEAYRKALDRCPNFHDIRHRLGVALREAGRPHRALVEFRRIREHHPDYQNAAIQEGLTLYSLGRADEARREWQSVLERDPDHLDALMYLRLVPQR